jgi:hypothetical protein
MTLTNSRGRITPKQKAAEIVGSLVDLATDDWTEWQPDDTTATPAEVREVRRQVEVYQRRVRRLLGLANGT